MSVNGFVKNMPFFDKDSLEFMLFSINRKLVRIDFILTISKGFVMSVETALAVPAESEIAKSQ